MSLESISQTFIYKCFLVMTGGGIGAVCRYSITLLAVKLLGGNFPYGTMVVNLTGCFLIGICFQLSEICSILNTQTKLFFMTGFLGGLTTFSSFALETVITKEKGEILLALINFVANNILGIFLVSAGIWLVKYFTKMQL